MSTSNTRKKVTIENQANKPTCTRYLILRSDNGVEHAANATAICMYAQALILPFSWGLQPWPCVVP